MAFVVPRAGTLTSEPHWSEAFAEFCRANMANYKVSRRYAIVPQLPLNASRKVVKPELPACASRL
jgi:acyl-coenzyme A synthetase/AMP-(fatty) acid ligase